MNTNSFIKSLINILEENKADETSVSSSGVVMGSDNEDEEQKADEDKEKRQAVHGNMEQQIERNEVRRVDRVPHEVRIRTKDRDGSLVESVCGSIGKDGSMVEDMSGCL